MKPYFAVAAVMLATACAQTSVKNSWKSPEDTGPALRRIMVVGITSRADVRRTFEDAFVAELKAAGIEAVPSYASEPELGPESKEKLRTAVKASAVDGVLVTRLVRREQQTQVVQSTPAPVGFAGMGLYGGYPRMWGGYYDPGTVVTAEVVTAEVNVFRVATEKLAWAGSTETFAPSDIVKSTKDFAQVVIAALSKDKLL